MPFWEIAGLFMQVVQLGFYLTAVGNYKNKLEEFAIRLEIWADDNKLIYKSFRDLDPDFYDYYNDLPDYQVCDSNIKRGAGKAFHDYGTRLRQSLVTTRGYTPLAKVHLNTMLGSQAVADAALHRTVTTMKERQNVDNHILERWSAIVSAPIGLERYQSAVASGIIKQSFTSLKGAAQGFNSAGAAFGTQLFRILN